MATFVTNLKVSRLDSLRTTVLHQGRTAIEFTGAENRKVFVTSGTPQQLGPVHRFIMMITDGPVEVHMGDGTNVVTHVVRGLFLSYISIDQISVTWDSLTQNPATVTVEFA